MKNVFFKKMAIVAIAAVTMSVAAHAQIPTFNKGDNLVGAGIGFGGTLYSGSGYSNKMPAISFHYEHCVVDNLWDEKSSIGVGGILGYTSAKWEYSGYGWKYSSVIIGARGSLHYAFVDKLDTYAGLMIGYNIVSAKETGSYRIGENTYRRSRSAACSYFFVGGRYYLTDNFAAFAELGYGIAIINLGVSIKF